MASKRIQIGIGFDINKAALNELSKSLDAIIIKSKMPGQEANAGLQEAAKNASQVANIIEKSFNKELGSFNMTRFNKELSKSGLTLDVLRNSFSKAGKIGEASFNKLGSQILNTNIQLKQSNKLLDDMAESFANTVKWGISSSIFNSVTSAIQKAYDYSVDLNTSLTDIRIVTEYSAEAMDKFAEKANTAAKNLGANTLDYTNAALIYYQQGLDEEEVQSRAQTTIKAANVTGQSGAEVSEQLTAVWNGYKVSAQESELYIDKLAAVAAATAADLEELSTGMSKVASAANLMGVDIDQLNAQLATIVSITRQAPESVGTALKTIYARMGDIEAGLDGEVTLDEYTSQMAEMGVYVLNADGKLRDMGEVIEEVGENWSMMSREQQVALSQIMAGTRQYNNLLSLFDNWDDYTEALNTSKTAAGELQRQQDTYMESTQAHLNQLTASWQDLYNELFDEQEVNVLIDGLTNGVQVLENFFETFGGGSKSIVAFGALVSNIFSKQIGKAINGAIKNIQIYKDNVALLEEKQRLIASGPLKTAGRPTAESKAAEAQYETELKYARQIQEIQHAITSEEYEQLTAIQQENGELEKQKVLLEAELERGIQNASKQGLNKEELENFLNDPEVDEEFYAEKTYTVTSNRDSMFKEFDNAEKYLKATENIADEYNEIAGSLKIISKYKDSLTDSQKKLIKDLKKEKDLSTTTKAEKNEILKIIERIKKEVNQQVDKATKEQKIAEKMLNTKKQINAIEAKQKDNDNDFDYMMDADKAAADIQAKVNGVVGVASGLVNIFNTASSAVRILKDETLSAGDKATQLIMLMATSLPMLVSQIDNIASSLGHTTPILQGLIAYTQIHNGLKEKSLALQKFENLTAEEKAALTAKNIILDEAGISLEAKKAGAKTVSLQLSGANVTVTEAEAIAYGHANVALDLFNKSLLVTNALKHPTLLIIGAITTAVIGLATAIYQISDANRKAAELGKAREDLTKSSENYENAKKEVEAVRDLATAYKELTKDYEKNLISLEELRESTYILTKKYGQEDLAIKALTADYNELTKSIKQAEYEKNKTTIEKAIEQKDSIQNTLNKQLKVDIGSKIDYRYMQGKGNNEVIDLKGMAVRNEAENKLLEDLSALGIETKMQNGLQLGFISLQGFSEAVIKDTDKIKTILENSSTDAAKQLLQYIDDNSELLEQAIEAEKVRIEALKETLLMDTLGEEEVDNVVEYKNYMNSLINQSITEGIFEDTDEGREEAKVWAQNQLDSISEEVKNYGKIFTVSQLTDNIKNEDAKAYVQGLSVNDQYTLLKSGINPTNLIKEDLEKIFTYVKPYSKADESTPEIITQLQDMLLGDEKDFDQEVYDELFSQLEGVLGEDGSPKYEEVLKDFDNKTLAEKIHLLTDIAEAQNEINKARLEAADLEDFSFAEEIEKAQEKIDKIELIPVEERTVEMETELQELQARVKALGDAEIKIKVDLDSTQLDYFENRVNDIVNSGETLQKAAEYIGKGYKVAKEDVAALADVYPELMQNAEVYTDGSVKLNQQIVQAILNGNKDVLLSSRDLTAEQLKQKIALLDAEIAFQQKNLKILDNLLTGKISETEAEEQLTKNQGQYEEDVINAVGLTREEAINQGLIQNAESTKITLTNLDAIGETIERVSKAYSKMLAGEEVSYESQGSQALFGDVSNYKESSNTKEVQSNLSAEARAQIQKQRDDIAKELEALHDTRGTYTDLLSQLYAGTDAAADSMGRAAAGQAGKKDDGSGKDVDRKDNLEDEKDIYHDINIILKQISTELDRLEKQEEKLVGQDLIDNLNEQWGRLQDTIDATNEKIKIARGEMSRLQGELGAKGVTFNPDGTIANYAAAYNQQLATVNAVINHYNSLSADAQEGYKETVEQAEKNWEEFLDNISEYDELVSEMIPELEDEIQAAIDEQIEIQIEKFNMEIELRLDMAEAEREWNEFKKKIIDDIEDDDILGNASAKLLDYNSYYKEDGTGVIQKNTQHVNEIIEQLKSIEATGTSSIYGDNEAQALEDLKTYYEQLMSDLTDVHDLIDEIRESYLDMMDEAQEKFDEQVETYEYIRDLLTHDMDLITMVYGDEAYDKLVDFYEKQEDNYNKQLDFQRQQKDFWKAQMDSLEEGSDEWQKAKENWMSAVEEWNSLVEEAIENLQDKYLNAINNIFANLNDKVTGGLGLDYVEQEWDLINKNADQYLDTINAVFETQQLENKYLDAIDDTDNISAQRKLNDLMKEEIKALEQKDKLTQYDIDRANLKYEIALKQIALEEAQQTKSSMRLRRDSQGNYRYEFVADNDAIAEAEDELSVLQNQLYNMDVEQYRSNLDQLYEIYVEWQEALAEAAQINDPEARAERELMINEQYGELINGIVEENEVIKTNLRESAFDELVNLHQMELEEVEALSQAEKDIMLEEMVPQWTSGVQTMADTFAGEGGFIPTCKDALIELDGATKDYEDSLVELQYQGGFTFNDIVAGENEAIYTAMGLLQVNNELINSYKAEFDALNAVLSQLDGLIGKYGSAQNAANAAAEAAYKYADALLAQFAAAQGSYTGKGYFYNSGGSSSRGTATAPTQKNTSGSGGVDTTKNNNTTSKNTNGKSGTYAVFEEGGRIAGSVVLTNGQVTSSSGVMKLANQPRKVYLADGSYVGTFATGGYTGNWNSSEGKIGILHQKELVLNQRDTENILGAVEIMRSVTNSIDNSIFERVAQIQSGFGINHPELENGVLEQNVHIEANFPNVRSSEEIKEAINNLTNIASQRANKSTRY